MKDQGMSKRRWMALALALAMSASAGVFASADGENPLSGAAQETEPEFVPSVDEVVRGVMRSYLSGFIYSALLDSFCSEQNARVTAMDAANVNAQELLDDLSLQLNRTRQSAITQEITEISAGAQAQKHKKKGGERA